MTTFGLRTMNLISRLINDAYGLQLRSSANGKRKNARHRVIDGELQESELIKLMFGTHSPNRPDPPRAPLRAGRPSQRIGESRLNYAPPPNSIRYYRRRAGMSPSDVGKLVGVTRETIRRLENRDTWLVAERAAEIARALNLPKEVLGFSYAADAYSWAAKAIPVVGAIVDNDEVKFEQTGRRVAGGAHLPVGSVGLDIKQGKMRGWLLVYRNEGLEPTSDDVLHRQGFNENFISRLADGTTWWRHIRPAAKPNLYHVNSRHLDPLNDVRIEWVAKIVGIEPEPFELPTLEQLNSGLPWADVPQG